MKRYNWKKGIANAAMIFIGVILIHLTPHVDTVKGTVDPIVLTAGFWSGIVTSGIIITAIAEAKYIYAWLATINNTRVENK